MFNDDYKTIQKMTPALQRVVVIDPAPAVARLISELMRSIARSQVWTATSTEKALGVCRLADPQIIFVEMSGPGVDGYHSGATARDRGTRARPPGTGNRKLVHRHQAVAGCSNLRM